MSNKIELYCLYNQETNSFILKDNGHRYSKFDPSKTPSYSEAYYGYLVDNVIDALKLPLKQAKEFLDLVKTKYTFLKHIERGTIVSPKHFELKKVVIHYEQSA